MGSTSMESPRRPYPTARRRLSSATTATSRSARGRDVHMHAHVVAVRQNFATSETGDRWPAWIATPTAARVQHAVSFSTREARDLGVTILGHIVHAAGDRLTLATLADAPSQAGAVTGTASTLDCRPLNCGLVT